jgi:hypothetical protein
MPDKMPSRDDIAKMITEDVDDLPFGGPEGPEGPEAGMEAPDDLGMDTPEDPMGAEVEPITMDRSLLQMLLSHMEGGGEEGLGEPGLGEPGLEEPADEGLAGALADAALEHSKAEGVEDPDSEGIMTGERDFDEILAIAQEMMGEGGPEEPEMPGDEVVDPGMEGGEEEGAAPPFESKKNKGGVISEDKEQFQKLD